MPETSPGSLTRADRILDAAGSLLLRHGYRKVNVEDIARQAGIGKGTVYLHWRTKEMVLEALLLRESVSLVEELLDRIREDPAEITPHRFVRSSYLATVRRPLVSALVTGDVELLGRLMDSAVRSKQLLANERFVTVLTRYGLLRDDVAHLAYAMQATSAGFYLIDNLTSRQPVLDLDLAARANAFADTIRHAFEPPGEPDPGALKAAATELSTVFEELVATYRAWIYSTGPARPSG